MKKERMNKLLSLLPLVLAVGCGTDTPQRVLAPGGTFSRGDDDNSGAARFSAWSSPVNLGPPVNTAFAEQTPAISRDGRTLYFHCIDCAGGYGGTDIWVAERASDDDAWGAPRPLGPEINTAANESSPALSRDGRTLFFDSDRAGGYGGFDIYAARRQDKRDNLSWQAPVNLGSGINTAANEQGVDYFANDEEGEGESATLYFASNRAGGAGSEDIYSIALNEDGQFGPAVSAPGLNTSFRDSGPTVRRDGLEIVFASNRPGGSGGVDLWAATRARVTDPWSTPVNLGPSINGTGNDAGPAFSFDGTALYFHSAERAGNVGGPFFDILVATRDRLRTHD